MFTDRLKTEDVKTENQEILNGDRFCRKKHVKLSLFLYCRDSNNKAQQARASLTH